MAGEPTLPSVGTKISVRSSQTRRPRVIGLEFGDGYFQRTADGLNSNSKIFRVRWATMSVADSKTMMDFFEARGGHEAFLWAPPDEASSKYICPSWSESYNTPLRREISAAFQEVFDP